MTTRRETGHLLRRAGFGARPSDFDAFAPLSWEQAVDRVLDYQSTLDPLPGAPTPTRMREDSDELRFSPFDVIGWWLDRMLRSGRGIEEKLTFFWHDHFATAITKAPPPFMANQVNTLRSLALGNFRDLLVAVATDPAMLVYLDGRSSVAGNPNENYARELYELHTLGNGNYTETDVQETARALTGWGINRRSLSSRFRVARHDGGVKTIFGQTGTFDLDDIADMILEHPVFPEFMVGKLARYFVAQDVSDDYIAGLAESWVADGFEIYPLMRRILLSDEFRSGSYRALIKNPLEFVLTATRNLDASVDARLILFTASSMGLIPLNPPTPAGWPAGAAWVNGNSVLARSNFANALMVAGRENFRAGRQNAPRVAFDPTDLLEQSGAVDAGSTVDTFVDLLLDGEIDFHDRELLLDYLGADFLPDERAVDEKGRGLVYLLLSSPAYALA